MKKNWQNKFYKIEAQIKVYFEQWINEPLLNWMKFWSMNFALWYYNDFLNTLIHVNYGLILSK